MRDYGITTIHGNTNLKKNRFTALVAAVIDFLNLARDFLPD
jgi:hypothetical protein